MQAKERPKVLVVAREHSDWLSIFFALSGRYECLRAQSTEEAKNLFGLGRDDIAVAILDIVKLGGDVLAFSKIIKERSPATEVILVTNYCNLMVAKTACQQGARGYLTKSFDPGELRDCVVQAVNSRAEKALGEAARKAMHTEQASRKGQKGLFE